MDGRQYFLGHVCLLSSDERATRYEVPYFPIVQAQSVVQPTTSLLPGKAEASELHGLPLGVFRWWEGETPREQRVRE